MASDRKGANRTRRAPAAVDNSEHSLRAVRFALSLARENGLLALHLATVHDEPLIYGEIAVCVTREKMEELQRRHSEGVLAPAEAMLKEAGVSFEREIVIGPIARGIADCAARRDCDAIIMGSRGRGAVGNLVLGSGATKVLHLAHVPVVVVKSHRDCGQGPSHFTS